VDTFLENAQKIFDVARSAVARSDDNPEPNDFALLVNADGGLHFVMESGLSLDSPLIYGEARTAYHVTKTSRGGVRVAGRSGNLECLLERHDTQYTQHPSRFAAELLRDQPLYRITSPLTISASSSCDA
jgi:hypothetical protein